MLFWVLFACQEKTIDTAQPSSEPESQPTNEPTNEPESQPSSEPESQPTSEPTSEPESQPSSEPESQPTDEPILEGQAEYSFSEAIEIPTNLFVDAIDLDGDSYVDIVLKETTGGYSWSKGDGQGSFSPQGILWDGAIETEFFAAIQESYGVTPTDTIGHYNEQLGDFDQDGFVDLVQTVQVIHASESYWGIALTKSIFDPNTRNHEILMIETDHLQPRMVQGQEITQFSIFSPTGIWLYQNTQLKHLSASNPIARFDGAIFTRDFDEDGNNDYYVLHNSAFGFIEADLYLSQADGYTVQTYTEGVPFSHIAYGSTNEFWVLTFDEAYLLSDDASTWTSVQSFDAYGPSVMGDFGGDGYLDVLTRNSQEMLSYYGDGQGSFTENTSPSVDLGYNTWVGDVNQDGKDDILDPQQDTLWLYLAQ